MGLISRLNSSHTDPYEQWRERLEERNGKPLVSQGVKEARDGKEDTSLKEEEKSPVRRTKDEYVPGADRTPEPGRLPEKDKEPDKAPKKADGKGPETYRGSTDKVDREIEKLKKRKEELEGQIRTEKDESRVQSLERELAQVLRELSQKDNDGYRRRHTVVMKM